MIQDTWSEAKELTRTNFSDGDWSRVMDVYHYLGGRTKQFMVYPEGEGSFRVLGIINDTHALVHRSGDNCIQQMERVTIERLQKRFKDVEDPLTLSLNVPEDIQRQIEGSLFITREMDTINV